jgi:hypothetical protein
MALNFRVIGLANRHLAVCVCWGLLALGMTGAALAMTRVEVFQATVPATDRSESGQTAAFQAALRVVLVRATGRRSADEEAVFAPLVGNARRYVQQYRSAADNQLWVAFDGAAIERWLIQNGQPMWGRDRPSTFVWLTVPGAAGSGAAGAGTVLSIDDTSDLKSAVDAAAALRGIPLIWPSAEAAAASGSNPADVGHRLGADAILVGRASAATANAVVHWSFQFQDHGSEFSGTLDGINHAADVYAGLYAASGSLAPVDIDVTGIADVQDYASVQAYLESLAFVTHVAVESLGGDTVRFRLTSRGGTESLQRAVALNGRLQSLPAGEGGIQRFELRR